MVARRTSGEGCSSPVATSSIRWEGSPASDAITVSRLCGFRRERNQRRDGGGRVHSVAGTHQRQRRDGGAGRRLGRHQRPLPTATWMPLRRRRARRWRPPLQTGASRRRRGPGSPGSAAPARPSCDPSARIAARARSASDETVSGSRMATSIGRVEPAERINRGQPNLSGRIVFQYPDDGGRDRRVPERADRAQRKIPDPRIRDRRGRRTSGARASSSSRRASAAAAAARTRRRVGFERMHQDGNGAAIVEERQVVDGGAADRLGRVRAQLEDPIRGTRGSRSSRRSAPPTRERPDWHRRGARRCAPACRGGRWNSAPQSPPAGPRCRRDRAGRGALRTRLRRRGGPALRPRVARARDRSAPRPAPASPGDRRCARAPRRLPAGCRDPRPGAARSTGRRRRRRTAPALRPPALGPSVARAAGSARAAPPARSTTR